VLISANLVPLLNGNTFDAAAYIGVNSGTISAGTPVEWKHLGAGYELWGNTSVTVAAGATLTVDAGTTVVNQQGSSAINVSGTLNSRGVDVSTNLNLGQNSGGIVYECTFNNGATLYIDSSSGAQVHRNDFSQISSINVSGTTAAAFDLSDNYWGTVTASSFVTHASTTAAPNVGNAVQPFTLGGRVWSDANGNGYQDFNATEEAGVPNLAVTIKDITTPSLVITGSTGPNSTVTDSNGDYFFVIPQANDNDQFIIAFPQPASLPTGYSGYTMENSSVDHWSDSNANPSGPNVGQTAPVQLSGASPNFTVDAGLVAGPVITINPVSETVTAGQTATFTAAASGSPAPSVQWQVSTNRGSTFTNIADNANTPTLTLTNVTVAQSGDEYRAVFTNAFGTATTTAAILTVGDAPYAIAIDNNKVSASAVSGTKVGNLQSYDVDSNTAPQAFTYTLGTDGDNSAFSISGNMLFTTANFNPAQQYYHIQVTSTEVSSGLSYTTILTVIVNTVETDLSNNTFPDNTGPNKYIGTLVSFGEAGPFTYQLGNGGDNSSFIIENGNQLFTSANAAFNAATQAYYHIQVTTTAPGGTTFTTPLTVIVTPSLGHAPYDVTLANNTIPYNTPIGSNVGRLDSYDVDSNFAPQTFTYSLGAGGDNSAFKIVGNELVTNALFSMSHQVYYHIQVTSTETSSGLSATFPLTIIINPPTPTVVVLPNNSIANALTIDTTTGLPDTTDQD